MLEHTGNDCGPDEVRWWDKIKRKQECWIHGR